MRKVLFVTALLFISAVANLSANSPCSECHGEKDFIGETEDGKERSLFVDEDSHLNSVHGSFECVDCHVDAEGDPHNDSLERVNCGMCHEDSWEHFASGIHGKLFMAGDSAAPSCASCHTAHNILFASDTNSSTCACNLPVTCGKCHGAGGIGSHADHRVNEPVENFQKGVHGKALQDGNNEAASCNDCHESHKLLPPSDPSSPIFLMNISKTCGKCHEQESGEYDSSIHGVALANGEFDSPTCTNCHGEHKNISLAQDDNNSQLVEETCAPCHSIAKLNEKYGILRDVVSSYQSSYHGLASAGGSKVAAKCTSCHGIHNIFLQSDPRSTIHADNLVETCGSCHPNATESFAQSYIHENPDSIEDKITSIVRLVYIWLIVVVIGGMLFHNFIIWFYYVKAKIRALKAVSIVQRFDRHWVIQHVSTFLAFTTLVITGFALKYPDQAWVRFLSYIGLDEVVRGVIHRIAAVVLIVSATYQFIFLIFIKKWKGELVNLLPNIGDVKLFVQNMKFYLGMSKDRPDFERYGYVEKAEYWALVWGNAVMAVTGFILWFPTAATKVAPPWIIKVSEAIHFYEAWLAFLAIVVYHMFFALFHPEDYPINLTGFTGKMPEEEVKERFPAWYRKLQSKKLSDDSNEE
jgi:formate dehydrogenase gamma subunit